MFTKDGIRRSRARSEVANLSICYDSDVWISFFANIRSNTRGFCVSIKCNHLNRNRILWIFFHNICYEIWIHWLLFYWDVETRKCICAYKIYKMPHVFSQFANVWILHVWILHANWYKFIAKTVQTVTHLQGQAPSTYNELIITFPYTYKWNDCVKKWQISQIKNLRVMF